MLGPPSVLSGSCPAAAAVAANYVECDANGTGTARRVKVEARFLDRSANSFG
jgi:hypothetical protein